MQFLIFDSVTQIPAHARGRVVLAASHAGIYSAHCVTRSGAAAVILHDAGVGRERAGIAALSELDRLAIPGATISHLSARIGDGWDCFRRGVLSFANEGAARAGLFVGQSAHAALERLQQAMEQEGAEQTAAEQTAAKQEASRPAVSATQPNAFEARRLIVCIENIAIVALDSNSLVQPGDARAIVMTGSHGGLLGGNADSAIKHQVLAAAYNDADVGIDEAGVSRLPALAARGISAFTVSAWSARIGDGLSTYEEGFVTRANSLARENGAQPGLSARETVTRLIESWQSRKTM